MRPATRALSSAAGRGRGDCHRCQVDRRSRARPRPENCSTRRSKPRGGQCTHRAGCAKVLEAAAASDAGRLHRATPGKTPLLLPEVFPISTESNTRSVSEGRSLRSVERCSTGPGSISPPNTRELVKVLVSHTARRHVRVLPPNGSSPRRFCRNHRASAASSLRYEASASRAAALTFGFGSATRMRRG
jgi:hypothetical protein